MPEIPMMLAREIVLGPMVRATSSGIGKTGLMRCWTDRALASHFLASLRIGSAGSFCRPPLVVGLFSQSEKSQRSKSRPSFGGVTVLSTALIKIGLIPSSDAVEITFSSLSTIDSLDCRSPSRYSRTSTHSTTKLQLTFLSNTITNQLCT